MKKGALQISFPLIFAILVGAIILFFAIYGTTKMFQAERTTIDAKTGKEIGVLLNPLETGFETGVTTLITIPAETRIYNTCSNFGNFGKQYLSVSQKSFNQWSETDIDIVFANKYIFSEDYEEGKKFYVFSKPFEFPFKVANPIYITSSNNYFCFITPPDRIYEEISDLGQANLLVENCTEENIHVCFETQGCDIDVHYNQGYVEKGSDRLYFETDALMYAAIFSDPNIYECEVKRLIKRAESLAVLYKNKSRFLRGNGCISGMESSIASLENSFNEFESSEDLLQLKSLVENLNNKNEDSDCRLW